MSNDEKYPRGKLNANDEGAMQMKIGVKDRTVVLDFGTEVTWIGMSGDQAAELAMILLQRAKEAGLSKPIVLQIG